MSTLSSLGNEVIHLAFSVAILLLMLRLLLQLCRADFYNPLSQAVVRATSFLDPLRRPLGQYGGLDVATLLTLVAVQVGEVAVSYQLVSGMLPGFLTLFATASLLLLDWLLTFYFWAILGVVVISWVAPDGRNPLGSLLYSLTEPLLGPARRLLPPLGGLDFSPMVVMFLLHALQSYGLPVLAGLLRSLPG